MTGRLLFAQRDILFTNEFKINKQRQLIDSVLATRGVDKQGQRHGCSWRSRGQKWVANAE